MHEHILSGIQPKPIGSYLQALGVLRILSEQRDASATGHWTPEGFVLGTALDRAELTRFFLEHYQPSPSVSPWNGAGGFYFRENKSTGIRDQETAATRALSAVAASTSGRFDTLRAAIGTARVVVDEMSLSAAPGGADKVRLVNKLRDRLADDAVAWIDAALVVSAEDLGFPPLLGTGGTEGALDFASNYYQRLDELFDFAAGSPNPDSGHLLTAALFGEAIRGLNTKAAIGQFDPGNAGGGNAGPGFDGRSVVNSWLFVLLLEGAFLLASATTKKLGDEGPGALAYPFSVRAVGAGYASAAAADESDSRNELWLPLWHMPTRSAELLRLFGEGRAEVGRRQAVHAVDFARALGTLGVDRGIDAFERYGFHKRNGKSYFATPLGRWRVTRNPQLDLVDEALGRWIDQLRSAARSTYAPASWERAAKVVERALLRLAGAASPPPALVQSFLVALAHAESTLGATPNGRAKLAPVPRVSDKWLQSADDGSHEHELALSLATTPIRERLSWAGGRAGRSGSPDGRSTMTIASYGRRLRSCAT
ncbi:MAG: type I-U CRISPR-associated protein Csx17 [Myxococcota bacterium]